MAMYINPITDVTSWFNKAKPEPTPKDLSTQIGVHFEEVAEFLENISFDTSTEIGKATAYEAEVTLQHLEMLSRLIKEHGGVSIDDRDRAEVLDALCDQVVTATGVAVCAGMNMVGGMHEVNRSNFSKFDSNGNPILDNNRKIMKGPDYSKADFTPYV